jgi:hypothetical protein
MQNFSDWIAKQWLRPTCAGILYLGQNQFSGPTLDEYGNCALKLLSLEFQPVDWNDQFRLGQSCPDLASPWRQQL